MKRVRVTQQTSLCFCVLFQLWWPALQRAAVCQLLNASRFQTCLGKGREGKEALPEAASGAWAGNTACCQGRASALERLWKGSQGAVELPFVRHMRRE